ncbi:hypothetical protein [Wenxinia saemankumensis]|uniref:hypothetical protein n=1 Tax=Wenxinia saemankumensis TaxID=1447782 RepID=UPI000934C351|nr:hypothetical protein [Wenxinia saemankumensis]
MEEIEERSVPDFSMAYITRDEIRQERLSILRTMKGFRDHDAPRTNDPAVADLIGTFTGALARQRWSGEARGLT